MEELKLSSASEWVIKVTDKDTLTITCPQGFEGLVGANISAEVLNLAVAGAIYKKSDAACVLREVCGTKFF